MVACPSLIGEWAGKERAREKVASALSLTADVGDKHFLPPSPSSLSLPTPISARHGPQARRPPSGHLPLPHRRFSRVRSLLPASSCTARLTFHSPQRTNAYVHGVVQSIATAQLTLFFPRPLCKSTFPVSQASAGPPSPVSFATLVQNRRPRSGTPWTRYVANFLALRREKRRRYPAEPCRFLPLVAADVPPRSDQIHH